MNFFHSHRKNDIFGLEPYFTRPTSVHSLVKKQTVVKLTFN